MPAEVHLRIRRLQVERGALGPGQEVGFAEAIQAALVQRLGGSEEALTAEQRVAAAVLGDAAMAGHIAKIGGR